MDQQQPVQQSSPVPRQSALLIVVMVFVGGTVGSLARDLLTPLLPEPKFWVPILLVNLIACFLIGYLYVLRLQLKPWLTSLLVVGFCGGFSTFSQFSHELVILGDAGAFLEAAVYVVLAVVLGVAAAVGGEALALRFHQSGAA